MMEKDYLKEIANNTSLRPSFRVVLTGIGSRLDTKFIPPLDFRVGCKYEIALVSLETYFSFPNIQASNNKLKVYINQKWEEIIIPIGCYELEDINLEIQRQIVDKKGKKDAVTLTPNLNTFKCIMTLSEGVKVDFRGDNSIRTVLGFDAGLYIERRNVSQRTVDIMRVNSLLVHCNLIGSSYLNGSQQPISYAFFPDSLPGEKIVERPNTLIYLPIALDVIPHMTSWLTDQNNNPIDLRGEKLTLKYHIRAC